MSDDESKERPSMIHQLGAFKVGETPEETVNHLLKFLPADARQQATTSAATVLTLTSYPPTVVVTNKLLDDLRSLADQTEGRKSETLSVIIQDPDSTCEQFGYNKGSLTDVQARILLSQIVSRREIEEQHQREMEKVTLQTGLGFFGKLLSWAGKGGAG